MTEVTINVSGEMERPASSDNKLGHHLTNFLQMPAHHVPLATKEWLATRRQHVRPWLQFVQTSNFRMPVSLPRLSKRIMRNIEYFQSNYLFVFLGLIAYCLITSPLLLIALAGSAYAGYKLSRRHEQKKLTVFGHELTLAQQYGLVAACSMPVYYMVGAGAAMFWVLGASFFVITLHAAFYNIDALIAEQDDTFGLTQEV